MPGILLSDLKHEILPFSSTQMDPEGVIPSKISRRMTNTAGSHLHVASKKFELINVGFQRLKEGRN